MASLSTDRFNPAVADMTEHWLDSLAGRFKAVRNINVMKKDSVTAALIAKIGKGAFLDLKENFTNKRLREILLDEYNTEKSIETSNKIIQKYEPVYMKPVSNNGRAHFYAPYKKIGKMSVDTFRFNIIVLWLVSLVLYLVLYFKVFKKVLGSGFSIRMHK
jgi:cell division protein FtsX